MTTTRKRGNDGRVRGAVNLILNGLVREGVITGFETNLDNPASLTLALHVRATADVITDMRNPAYDEKRVRAIRARIAKDIEPVAPGLIVSVRTTPATATTATREEQPRDWLPSGEQCREARRMLGWPLHELARRAGVSVEPIGAFERGQRALRPETYDAIIGPLKAAGVEFTRNGRVNLRKPGS